MKEERLVDGYYQSNIKTSRNEDSVYAMKYASQQILIDKLEEENKSLQSQLKAKEDLIKEVTECIKNFDYYDGEISDDIENIPFKYVIDTDIEELLEIISKGENK